MKKLINACCYGALLLTCSVSAADFSGVEIEEVITMSSGGEQLRLRGAAIKNSAHQALYVGGLYLQNDAESVKEILNSDGAKRFVLYCQNSSIKPDALIRALNLGITVNHSEEELNQLAPMVEMFNKIWNSEIKEGDKVWVDFVPEKGTLITINGVDKGVIPGKAFYNAFLKSWIGDKPLNSVMKKQLLGQQQ